MKLFIDPLQLRKEFGESPAWLQKLMVAFADGLNYYLFKHPEVKPRVIHRFEPWMALSFTEGSIGGDIEGIDLSKLRDFYGSGPHASGGDSGKRRRKRSLQDRMALQSRHPTQPGITPCC